jgi:chemotaxis protein MotB
MITLLVAFFIMLYAMSVTNSAKFNTLAISVRSGFGNVSPGKTSILDGESGSTAKPNVEPPMPSIRADLTQGGESSRKGASQSESRAQAEAEMVKQLKKLLSRGKLANHVDVRSEDRGIVVTVLADKYTFDSGSAELKPAFRPVLDVISQEIEDIPNIIRVEGHTDDLPISNDRFPSNWQLSATRAANVLCYLVSTKGISPDRVNCVGYADRRPILPNTSDSNRAKNRRIEIVILRGSDRIATS